MAEPGADQHLQADNRAPRPRWAPLLGLLALLLVALVGLGSRAPLWDIGGPPRLVDPASYSGDLLMVVFALLVVGPWVLHALRARRRRAWQKPIPDLPPVKIPRWARIVAMLVLAAAIALSLFVISRLPGAPHRTKHGQDAVSVAAGKKPRTGIADHGPPVHWWGYALLALIVLAGAYAVWRLRTPPRVSRASPDEPDELLAAVDLSLEDIENEPDPRRAVIRAYARMESALGSYGIARRPWETPLEYLARALTSLRVGRASVERLAALFERAKFSSHEIDLSMKGDALAALGALRDELVEIPA